MSSPDRAAPACEDVQVALQALVVDGERPMHGVPEMWEHLAACDRCARALAHDRALSRALERLRGAARAPATLRERLRRLLCAGGAGDADRGRSRRGGSGGGSRST